MNGSRFSGLFHFLSCLTYLMDANHAQQSIAKVINYYPGLKLLQGQNCFFLNFKFLPSIFAIQKPKETY